MHLQCLQARQLNRSCVGCRYFGKYPGNFTMADVKAVFNPYKYGYITELAALADFKYTSAKVWKPSHRKSGQSPSKPLSQRVFPARLLVRGACMDFVRTLPAWVCQALKSM